MNASTIVVTGCDAAHFDLAGDLLASINAQGPRDFHLGFIQVGDAPAPPELLAAADRTAGVAKDGGEPAPDEGFLFAYLALKARLPELFPGYDTYVWLDADIWVQNIAGLREVIAAAGLADLCIHAEADPRYDLLVSHDHSRQKYEALYRPDERLDYDQRQMVNSGVFAARAASPLWPVWRRELETLAARMAGRTPRYYSDQVPLHRLICAGRLTAHPLRAVNNWVSVLALPAVDVARGRLMTPAPFEEINIVHLAGWTKDVTFTRDDSGAPLSLRYRPMRQLLGLHGG